MYNGNLLASAQPLIDGQPDKNLRHAIIRAGLIKPVAIIALSVNLLFGQVALPALAAHEHKQEELAQKESKKKEKDKSGKAGKSNKHNKESKDRNESRSSYVQPKDARALADKVMEALGGYTAFKRFNDVPCVAKGKIIQTSSLSGVTNTFDCDIIVKREKQKITITFLGQPLTTVYDGESCWTQQGDSVLPSDPITAKRIAEDILHGFLLLEKINFPDTRMEMGQPVTVEGRPCETLMVWAEDGEPTTFAIDKETNLVASSTYAGVDLEQGVKLEKKYIYSDYKPVESTKQPFRVAEYSADKKVSETVIAKVAIDESITDSLFTMAKEKPSARLAAGPITVPFEYRSNEILIRVKTNGTHDLRFIVDTGATQSILDKNAARKIGAESLGENSGLSMTTGSGSIQTSAVTVKSLAIGDLAINNAPFATADLGSFGNIQGDKPAGLIGANILKRYLVTIDYENEKLTFSDPTQVKIPAGATVISTKPSLGMSGLAVDGNIDGKQKMTFLIDTGAAFNNISETKVKNLLWGPLYKVGMLKGLDGKLVETGSARFNYLDIDNLRVEKPVFSIAPPPSAGAVEAGIISSKELAIIGNPLLSHYKVTLDYRNQRLFFEQSATQKKQAELTARLDAIKVEWLKNRNASQAIKDLTAVADSAHHDDLNGIEALARAEIAVMLCQQNGGDFTPEHIFAPLTPASLTSENSAFNSSKVLSGGNDLEVVNAINGGKSGGTAKLTPQELFSESDGQLLTAFNLSDKLADKSIQGRVLATWGYIYVSQCQNIGYLSMAKQKIGKAVVLAPTDPDVLAASGYFLARLEAVKPPQASEKEKAVPLKEAEIEKIHDKVAKNPALKPITLKEVVPAAGKDDKKNDDKKIAEKKGELRKAMTNASALGKWLAEQIIDQAIMIDPANWLALWTKLDRARAQGHHDEVKMIAAQLKHYYPSVNITTSK
jgi:predicted aspartyl protease